MIRVCLWWCFGFVVALVFSGCHGYKAPSYATLATMADAVGHAAKQVPPICEGRASAAVDAAKTRDEAVVRSNSVFDQCTLALNVLAGVGGTVRSARDAIYDAPAGADLTSIVPWLKLVAKQYCDLVPLLAVFQIVIPSIPGVC